MGYHAYGQEHLIDNSQLPEGSLVCEECSWPSDEPCFSVMHAGPCSICGKALPF